MNKDEELFQKRIIELSRLSYDRDIYAFTDFLNLNELDLFNKINKNNLYSKYEIFGGYKSAQRQMIKFIPDAVFYNQDFPFYALKIVAKSIKFSEKLGHRDYLGAILNLGIDRSKVGDILQIENHVICFIHSDLSDYIVENLIKVRNTYVTVNICEISSINYEPEFQIISGTVQSIRLDSILSLTFKLSRNQSVYLIEGAKVYVNGKLVTNNGSRINESDVISIRGYGKIELASIGGLTKKKKQFIEIKRYV